jgi:catechol 2,3-dioxygenase-like lactoylglutathione lyase family enzyme
VLRDARVATRLPAQDLERARAFYADKLGLEPVEERPGGLLYQLAGGSEFALFATTGAPAGTHTQMAFNVDDFAATIAELKQRGLELARFGESEIVEIEGNYPSKGVGERAAWFYDSEGNLLGIGQAIKA